MERIRGREIINRPDPAKQRALEEQERKHLKKCMAEMHLPKCVVDGAYKENKHNSEMNRKRQAYMSKIHRDYRRPVRGGAPMLDPIMPDWEAMNEMFPAYKKSKCYQNWLNEEQVRQLRNQQEFNMREGNQGKSPHPIGLPVLPNWNPQKLNVIEDEVSNASGPKIGGLLPYLPPYWRPLPKRHKKCKNVEERIKDNMIPNITKSQCASLCVAQNRKRQRDWNKPAMTDKQYIAYLEKQRDVPGTPAQEVKNLDNLIWNQKQNLCERERLYKLKCSKFQEKKEQNKLNALIPWALGGLALYVLLD
mgnify:CR=1 FL=1